MLNEGYIKINGNKYTPTSFEYSYSPVENIGQSEAGTELVSVIRLNKHIFKASWSGIDAELLDEIEKFCITPTVEFEYRGNVYTCRARGFTSKLLGKSYKYKHSDGLWSINLSFTEI